MLTKKQRSLLELIQRRIESTGVAPSFDEMKDEMGLKSKSGVHRMVMALKEKGFIARLENRARALEILPKALDALRTNASSGMSSAHASLSEAISISLMGRIAAGAPLEAIEDGTQEVQVPGQMLGKGEHFALQIVGDSMTGIGIMDGDTVVIERRENANNGEVVVALVDESEATLKRIYRKNGMIELHAENPDYENKILAPDRVRIQGRLCGLLRNY